MSQMSRLWDTFYLEISVETDVFLIYSYSSFPEKLHFEDLAKTHEGKKAT